MATALEVGIFVFCLIGYGISSRRLGRQEGIQGTISYFIEQGIIEVEEE